MKILVDAGDRTLSMLPSKQVLAAIANLEVLGSVEEFLLENAEAKIERVADGSSALSLATGRRFDLIVTEFPLRRLNLEKFLGQLRAEASTSRDSAVVVLTGSLAREEIEKLSPARHRRLDVCTSTSQTLRAVAKGLEIGDRVTAELPVRVAATTGASSGMRTWNTCNVSASGMLLAGDELLPIGLVLPISIELPEKEGMIHGHAEVVRHADSYPAGAMAMGLRFVRLFGDGTNRLAEFVHLERAFLQVRSRYLDSLG